MSLLASINFGIYLVLNTSHAYNTFLLASIYFGKIISCTKFTKINGKPIFQALQYILYSILDGMTTMANVSNLANHVDNSAPTGQSLLHAMTAAFEKLFHHVHSAYRSVLHLLAPHN